MYLESQSTSSKQNWVEQFTVLFWDDFIKFDDVTLPVGQCSVDLLNIEQAQLRELRRAYVAFAEFFSRTIGSQGVKKDLALVTAVQDKMNEVWDAAFALPPFFRMKLDKEYSKSILLTLFRRDPRGFARIENSLSHEGMLMTELLLKLQRLHSDALSFTTYISTLSDFFYERLKKRDAYHFSVGIYSLLSDTALMNEIAAALPSHPDLAFKLKSETSIEFTPMRDPTNEKNYVVAERLVFESLGDFLRADFFRGVARGNAPRRCHNCGKFFLLTRGYDVRYCTEVAPSETERTCRMVGAHKKEMRREGKTPAQKEYYKVYNRLKTRKSRGKISDDDWNRGVALAQDLRDKADRGELSEFELKRRFDEM